MVFQRPIYWGFRYPHDRMNIGDLEFQMLDDLTIHAEGKNNVILSAIFRDISIIDDDDDFSFSKMNSVLAWKHEFLSMSALIELQPSSLMHLNVG